MKCPSCKKENPEASRFCTGCGGAMEQVCPSCAATPPPGSSFCNGCGHDLSSPMAATLFGEMEMSWWCEQAEALRGRLERGEPFKGFAPYAE